MGYCCNDLSELYAQEWKKLHMVAVEKEGSGHLVVAADMCS